MSHGNDNNKNIVDKARDFVHEKVAKDEELRQERPVDEKLMDKVPKDTQELGSKVAQTARNAKDNLKEKFNERLDEGTEREKNHEQNQNTEQNPVLETARKTLYEKTKSPETKEREDYEQAPLTEKIEKLKGDHVTKKPNVLG